MPNLASIFKEEIARIARKEVKREIDTLKRASTRYRSEIAALKREVSELQKQQRRISSKSLAAPASAPSETSKEQLRFRSGGLASHRKRLGLSAEGLGKLLGVSGQTVYKWEQGKTRPRANQMPAIAALRTLGKRTAHAVLASR